MRQWVVYKHTSTDTGKSYIGMTCKTIEDRWAGHCLNAKTSGYHFHNAIAKYGTVNWEHEVLHSSIPTIAKAQELEKYYIKEYNTFLSGYNSTLGGEGNMGVNPLAGMSEQEYSNYCDRRSKEARARLGTQEYVFYNPKLDVKETCAVMDLANKYNLHAGCIRYVAIGKSEYANGWFLWKGEDVEYLEDPIYRFEHKNHGVESLTLTEMSNKYNLSKGNLSMVTHGKRVHTKGWTVVGNQGLVGATAVPSNAKTVQKIDYTSGAVVAEYTSVVRAAIANCTTESVIGDRCRGRTKSNTYKGFRYTFKQEEIGCQ